MFKRIGFISSAFLFEVADLLFLFALPVFLFSSTNSLIFTGLIFLLRPLGKLIGYTIYRKSLQEKNFVFLFLLAYTLSFIVLIVFNRLLGFYALVFAVFILGMSKEFFDLGLFKVENPNTQFKLGRYKKFLSPSLAFAGLSLSLFITKLVSTYQFQNLQNYFSILLSISGILFYFFISKKFAMDKQERLIPKVYSLGFLNIYKINWTIFSAEAVKAFYWVLFPIFIIKNMGQDYSLVYLIPSLYFPILLLNILKNTFLFKYWKIRPNSLFLVFTLTLLSFFFVPSSQFLILPTVIMGFVIGFIEISSWYKEVKTEDYPIHFNSSNLGFITALLIGSVFNTYIPIYYVLGVFGIVALLYFLIKKFRKQ